MKKRIKRTLASAVWLTAIILLVTACNSNLDVRQVYSFDLVTLPVPKKVTQGQTVEIRCQLQKEGDYEQAQYYIRWFPVDGEGELRMENGTVLMPNDLYLLEEDTFRLYYRSGSTGQQNFDIYIIDSAGQIIQKTFSLQNASIDKEEVPESGLIRFPFSLRKKVQRNLMAMGTLL